MERTSTRSRALVLAEALGYAGGSLVVIGVVLVVTGAWEDLATEVRIAATGGWAVPLVVVGWLARPALWQGPAATPRERFSDVVWGAAVATAAIGAGVAAHDPFGAESTEVIALAGSGVAFVLGASLWSLRAVLVTQALTWAAALTVAGSAGVIAASEGTGGAVVVLGSVTLVVIGVAGRSRPPWLSVTVGVVALPIGVSMVSTSWEATGLVLGAGLALVLVAVVELPGLVTDRIVSVVIGVAAVWSFVSMVPRAIGHFADQAGVLTGAVVALAAGVALVSTRRGELRAPVPVAVIGGLALVLAPAIMASESRPVGLPLGLVVASAAVVFAARAASTPPALLGGLGLAVYVPWSVTEVIEGDLAAPVAVIVTGAVLVAVALWLVIGRSRIRPEDSAASTPSSREPAGVGSTGPRSVRRSPGRPPGTPNGRFGPRTPDRRRGV